jgi:hypothetical protein
MRLRRCVVGLLCLVHKVSRGLCQALKLCTTEAFVATKCNKISLGDKPRQNGTVVQRFIDPTCLHHQGMTWWWFCECYSYVYLSTCCSCGRRDKLVKSGGRDLSGDLDIAHPDVPIIGLHRRVKYSLVHPLEREHKIHFCLAYIPKICLHKIFGNVYF